MLRNTVKFLKNKYIIAILFFLIYMTFLDRNNFIKQIRLKKEVNTLMKEKNYYIQEVRNDSIRMIELYTNPDNLERFAREKYLMKKKNEDVFVIVKENE